jgi:hypothetical protein
LHPATTNDSYTAMSFVPDAEARVTIVETALVAIWSSE